ncbi:hypothetical protein ANN_08544 [Periplaneta americana]|uniref:Uncharacterized protein n=1 Tax=Periplaneta americana TaxID=6978 RepID=A0ABQ8T353_PERAM|nr:hypothetical protein ANN_08544 [Periplaneta americana]
MDEPPLSARRVVYGFLTLTSLGYTIPYWRTGKLIFLVLRDFSCAAQQLNASQSTHRFSFVNHTIKTCAVSSTQKFLVQQHITTSKHQANKQLNSKQRQLFLTQPTTSNVRSEFNIDLCRSLISADIPLYKLKNKVFREFLEKYTQHTIPDESTLRKTYAPSIYDETIQKIRDEIKDSSIWVSIDETPDKEDGDSIDLALCIVDPKGTIKFGLSNKIIHHPHKNACNHLHIRFETKPSCPRKNVRRNVLPALYVEFYEVRLDSLTPCVVVGVICLCVWFIMSFPPALGKSASHGRERGNASSVPHVYSSVLSKVRLIKGQSILFHNERLFTIHMCAQNWLVLSGDCSKNPDDSVPIRAAIHKL